MDENIELHFTSCEAHLADDLIYINPRIKCYYSFNYMKWNGKSKSFLLKLHTRYETM